jgi:Tfp pilus assembly protein PilN
MKAVNLIPADEQRGLRGSGSGLGSYIVLAVLALVVAASAATTLTNRTLTHRRDKLAAVQEQTRQAQAEVTRLASYTGFSALRQKRSDTVKSLAASRFDWSHALHEVARTIPSDAWLTSLRGTVAPGISVEGGADDSLRSSVAAPALALVGCTTSQGEIARVISSLRRVDGVQRVTLSSSAKLDNSSGASGSAEGNDCRHGNQRFPEFSMILFFNPQPAAGSSTPGTTTP